MFSSSNNQDSTNSKQTEEQNLSSTTKKFLPEDAPIVMIWLVKEPSKLKYDQLPLPDNKLYPYKSKILSCADLNTQRKIRLYSVLEDLTSEQIQKMNDLMDINKGGKSNIKIIDFNTQFKGKYDLKFLKSEEIPFAWKIDMMRLIALIEDGPAIYFDFDALPKENQIERVPMNDVGYKMTPYIPWESDDLENSIIAVNSKDNLIISAIYHTMEYLISNSELLRGHKSSHLVWECHRAAITFVYNKIHKSQNIESKELEQELKEWLCSNKNAKCIDYEKRAKYFSYGGAGCTTRDFSWEVNQDRLYQQKELDLASEKDSEDDSMKKPTLYHSSESLESKEKNTVVDENAEATSGNDNTFKDKIIPNINVNDKKNKEYCHSLKETKCASKEKSTILYAAEKVIFASTALFTIAFASLLAAWCLDKFPSDKKDILLGIGTVAVSLIVLSVFCFCCRNKSEVSSDIENNGIPERLAAREKVIR